MKMAILLVFWAGGKGWIVGEFPTMNACSAVVKQVPQRDVTRLMCMGMRVKR